jgi:flagellar motor switch protein FliN
MSAVGNVEVELSILLGKAQLPMRQLLKMGRGAVIELDSHQDDEVWIMANNHPIARGEILIQGDRIAISISSEANFEDFVY